MVEWIVRLLRFKVVALSQLGLDEEALSVYEDVTARYDNRPEASVAVLVGEILFDKGVTLEELGRPEEALAEFDQVTANYASRPEAEFGGLVAKALIRKRGLLGYLGRPEERSGVDDQIVENLGNREDPVLAGIAIGAAFRKFELGRMSAERLCHDLLEPWIEMLTDFPPDRGRSLLSEHLPKIMEVLLHVSQPLLPTHLVKCAERCVVMDQLGTTLVESLRHFKRNPFEPKNSDDWVETWRRVAGTKKEMRIPLRLLNAGG